MTLCCVKVDEEPAIRANTTILLGNLAGYLSESACKRVLLNAFTRALKDSFPPARVAGVKVCTRLLLACCFQEGTKLHRVTLVQYLSPPVTFRWS